MLTTPVPHIDPEWRMPGFFSLTMRGTMSCSLAQMITAMRLPGAVPGVSGGKACLKRLLKGLSVIIIIIIRPQCSVTGGLWWTAGLLD